MEEEIKPNVGKRKLASCVKFSENEYIQLLKDQIVWGESIPILLKKVYFNGPRIAPLMTAEDARATLAELRRIGTNINQIAKHLNSGFREGWNEDFIQIRDSIAALRRFVVGFCGNN